MNITEVWRPVVGYEGAYEVSDQGRVRSLTREVYAGRGRTRLHAGRVLSVFDGDDYSKVRLKLDGSGSTKNVHSLVAEAFLGPCPADLEVCHGNGNRNDNRLVNLRYDTHSANALDRREHGTAFRRRNQDECFHGHSYTEGSFYIDSDSGKRVCLECERDRHRRRVAARHAENGTTPRAELTECKYGHPLDGFNGRQRFCTTCNREAQRRWRLKNKSRTDKPPAT